MNILDKLASFIAPHACILCGCEGSLLCVSCIEAEVLQVPSSCYICGHATKNFKTCSACSKNTAIKQIYRASYYDEPVKPLFHALKYERAYGALEPVEYILKRIENADFNTNDVVVTYVPTISPHIRRRGYDHAALIGRQFARARGLTFAALLRTDSKHRQVGSDKALRQKQVQHAYHAKNTKYPDRTVILVDDIVTTGATLESATKALKQAGYRRVICLAVAQSGR